MAGTSKSRGCERRVCGGDSEVRQNIQLQHLEAVHTGSWEAMDRGQLLRRDVQSGGSPLHILSQACPSRSLGNPQARGREDSGKKAERLRRPNHPAPQG